MPINASPSSQRPSQGAWRTLAYSTGFCVAIALLLWLLGVTAPLWRTLAVSLCIGWSIHLSFIVLGSKVATLLPAILVPVIPTAIGLSIGLLAAGSLVYQLPLKFFTDDYGSLIIGVFFGFIGFGLLGARNRLLLAREALAQAEVDKQLQQKLLLETELKLLQAQIEPHFLFNTLSNVIGLIGSQPAAAEKTLLNLTTLLRASLQRTRRQTVTLAEELTMVQAYLEIQSIRMRGRLRFSVSPPGLLDEAAGEHQALRHWPLPPLLVQPLVENAIKHGIDPREEGGQLELVVSIEAEQLKIRIIDNGVGINLNAAPQDKGSGFDSCTGTGTGLENVRGRLRALYGAAATMTLRDNIPSGLVIELSIPPARSGEVSS